MIDPLNPDEILKLNPHISLDRVARFRAFCERAETQGFSMRPTYRIDAPFGRMGTSRERDGAQGNLTHATLNSPTQQRRV